MVSNERRLSIQAHTSSLLTIKKSKRWIWMEINLKDQQSVLSKYAR